MQCDSCGKQVDRGEFLYRVVKTLSSGKHEEMSVCQKCRPSFQKIESLFEMGGKIYTDAERPPSWCNEAPLPGLLYRGSYLLEEQLPLLPLDDFPLIEDFDVVLVGHTTKHEQEDHLPPRYYAVFFSSSRGLLAIFSHEDQPEDLCRPDFVIPHGDFNTPYDDLGQNWNMLIVEDHAFVYVITGDWERGEAQSTWFKVERSLYYRQWDKTIQRCRALCHIEILDGPTYTEAERPPIWRNDTPLPPLLDQEHYPLEEQLPLDAFPLIEDFDVILQGVTTKHRQEDGLLPSYNAMFFSPSRGYLASLLEDEPEDLCRPDFVIPSGDFNAPYDDLGQNWNMLIVEDHAYVYIITGNWERGEAQRTWFKVERNLYYRQWEKTIQRCRALCRSQT